MTAPATTPTRDHRTVADEARLMAEVLATFPADIIQPTHYQLWGHTGPRIAWLLFGTDMAEQKAKAAAIMRSLGGSWEKDPGHFFDFKTVRGGVEVEITVDRAAVCERVVTGTHEETVEVPDPTVKVPMVTTTETVEDFEWVCAPVLGGAA